MAWVSRDAYLSQSEMENNANIVISYYRGQNLDDRTIAAILGNMQAESTLSPVLTERGGGGGYGLVQWTPKSNLTDACNTLNLSPYSSGDVQIKVIIQEIIGVQSIRQWYTSKAYIQNYYSSGASSDMIGITGNDFLYNTMNWTPDKLAVMFMAGYERPSYDPNVNHYKKRKQYANAWFEFMGGSSGTFIPRLNSKGIKDNPYWYSKNPFYLAGYGLPNCTCYAWGRFWEISDPDNDYSNRPTLSTGNAGQWYSYTQDGYTRGSIPKLGAVACFSDDTGGAGHVAIVEKIKPNGDIITSNSAYNGSFFYTQTLYASKGYSYSQRTFQGFIYNPFAHHEGGGDDPTKNKRNRFNFILSNGKKRRNLNYG